MYFTYGWPKVLSAFPGGVQEDIIYLQSDHDYLVIVSVTSIQLWTGGQHRVKRGQLVRDDASLKSEGLNRKACWSSSKKLLAVLVSPDSAVRKPVSGHDWPMCYTPHWISLASRQKFRLWQVKV